MRHSFIDKYSDRHSFIHSLDPRTKIIVFGAYIIAVVLAPAGRPGILAGCGLLMLALVVASRVPATYVLVRSLAILPFTVLTAFFMVFGARADAFTFLGTVALKSWLAVTAVVLLSSTTPFPRFLKGMERMKAPRILVLLLSFLYRYVFVLLDEAMCMERARKARYFGRGRRRQLKAYAGMVAVLFIRTYERGERVYRSMCARGFDGEVRTLDRLALHPRDACFAAAFAAAMAVILL